MADAFYEPAVPKATKEAVLAGLDFNQILVDFEACRAGERASPCERAFVLTTVAVRMLPGVRVAVGPERERQEAEFMVACARLPEDAQRCLTTDSMGREADCKPAWDALALEPAPNPLQDARPWLWLHDAARREKACRR